MDRITVKHLDSSLKVISKRLGLPEELYEVQEDGTYKANPATLAIDNIQGSGYRLDQGDSRHVSPRLTARELLYFLQGMDAVLDIQQRQGWQRKD